MASEIAPVDSRVVKGGFRQTECAYYLETITYTLGGKTTTAVDD